MKKNCDNCKYDAWDYVYAKPCSNCITKGEGEPSYWEASENYKPMTNADRIRAMTDEELAEWALYKAPEIGRGYTDSYLGLIKWLQQPAEGD